MGSAETAEAVTQLAFNVENITNKLSSLEELITKAANGGVATAATPGKGDSTSRSPRDASTIYHDPENPPVGTILEDISEEAISPQERSRLDYGKLLANMVGLGRLQICSAQSLPPPPEVMEQNAFRHSYRYDSETNTLHVHKNKFANSGDFGLVMIHALSHIKINDEMGSDYTPDFTAAKGNRKSSIMKPSLVAEAFDGMSMMERL